ncbi:MAG: hypothetical protein D3M94_10690 [Rhodocyclales bacterium GT-UBC]|nr:MAG: hypothetical protein D3M94_10690 [Rhodocyclales bacterium GT-UBC]
MRVTEILKLDQLEPGMQLAEPVLDESGRVLVPAGAEVNESLVHGLQRREIVQVSVSYEQAEDPAQREARLAQINAQLAHLFRKAGDDDATRQLQRAVMAFRSGDAP